MLQISPEYLSAQQAASYLGIAYETLKKNYPQWMKFGVIARRFNNKADTGKLRFKRSELDQMMDQWKVVK
jgi:predicted site-specific integrase-resolvase